MTRAWIGTSLLAGSWLLGLSYYHPASLTSWAVLVILGTILLAGSIRFEPGRVESVVAILLILPAVWLAPWPYRAAPLLLAAGLVALMAPERWLRTQWWVGDRVDQGPVGMVAPGRWLRAIGLGAVAAGAVLLAQSLAMMGYEHLTARSHELPAPLPQLLGTVAKLLGVDAATNGHFIAMHTMRQVHSLATTWELLVDPVSLCFLVGGLVVLTIRTISGGQGGSGSRRFVRLAWGLLAFTGCVLIWLPVRAGLLMAIYLHRALHTDYDAPLQLMSMFWNPWVLLGLLAGPVLLAAALVRPKFAPAPAPGTVPEPPSPRPRWRRPFRIAGTALAAAAIAAFTLAAVWDPPGEPKKGRVLVDEFHSTWEPTGRPYDTSWYGHESGYNYACMYDYCSRFYQMGRLTSAIDDAALSKCDVLMLKMPTSPLAPAEVEAVERFVERGGGLMLIGEHTDVFGTGSHLNDVARGFGFRFRFDVLFGIDDVFEELYLRPHRPHPVVQHLPPLDFAISCSIDPGWSSGRAVMIGTRLKSLTADYHVSNFYPQADDSAQMHYGAFVQLWATRKGAGRVLAYTDSTQFSNFCTFEPGKSEIMLGMIEWLNRQDSIGDPRPWLLAAGLTLLAAVLALLACAAWFNRHRRSSPDAMKGVSWSGSALLVLAGGLFGWAGAGAAVVAWQRGAMPPATPVRPMVQVAVDRTVCDAPLSKGGFIAGHDDGFGIFERWILRLGWFTHRTAGGDSFKYDMLVLMHPNKPVSDGFRRDLVRYVESGGKVLVLDSADNSKSTTNDLLISFGLSVRQAPGLTGQVVPPTGWPAIRVKSACEIAGGQPLAHLDGKPVAATIRHGRGSVTLVGFADRFTDLNMGVTGDAIPNDELMKVYQFEFALLRSALGAQPATQPSSPPTFYEKTDPVKTESSQPGS